MLFKKLNDLANSVVKKSEQVVSTVAEKYKNEGLDKIISDSVSKTTQVLDEKSKKTTAYIKEIAETNKKILDEIPSKTLEDNIAKVVAVVSNTTQTIFNDTVDNLGKILNLKEYTFDDLNSLNIIDVLVFMNASSDNSGSFTLGSNKFQVTGQKWFSWNDMKGGIGAVSLMTHILEKNDLNYNPNHNYEKDAIEKLASLFEIFLLDIQKTNSNDKNSTVEELTPSQKVEAVNSVPVQKNEKVVLDLSDEKLEKINKVSDAIKLKPVLYYSEGLIAEFKVMPIELVLPFLKLSKEGKFYNTEDTHLSFQVFKTKVKFNDGTETKNTLDFCEHLYQDKLAALDFLNATLNSAKYQKSLTKWIKNANAQSSTKDIEVKKVSVKTRKPKVVEPVVEEVVEPVSTNRRKRKF